MVVNNLSQFKKAMKDGHVFEIVEHFIKPERISTCNNGKGSWIEFGKASEQLL